MNTNNNNLETKIALLCMFSIIVLLLLLPSDGGHKETKRYKEMYQLVNEVSPTLIGDNCKRGATLVLLGRYNEVMQYEEDFGQCIRKTVKAVINKR